MRMIKNLLILIFILIISCSKSEKEEDIPVVIAKPEIKQPEIEIQSDDIEINYQSVVSNLNPEETQPEILPDVEEYVPEPTNMTKTVPPETNTNRIVEEKTPAPETSSMVSEKETLSDESVSDWFDIRIHPDDTDYIMAIYNLELEPDRNDVWASALMMGFDEAYQSASDTDTLAVGLVYTEGEMEVYTVSYADYFGYLNDELSLKDFLSKIRVIK